jgi:hypothetical protein
VGARRRAPRQQGPGTEQVTSMADNILTVGDVDPGELMLVKKCLRGERVFSFGSSLT